MSTQPGFDPHRGAQEIREQLLSSQRRIGFLFGAGSSISSGLPSLATLTTNVKTALSGQELKDFEVIAAPLGAEANLESILNRIRLIRELLIDSAAQKIDGVSGEQAAKIDRLICTQVYKELSVSNGLNLGAHMRFAAWLRQPIWAYPVEIFTTNYDLVFESTFEELAIPFFDGFVGALNPFFVPQAIEADGAKQSVGDYPPSSWIRLWKIHGSIGWQYLKGTFAASSRIVRCSGTKPPNGAELLIYPSREKYSDSRKLPYLAYIDRLYRFLSGGASLLVVVGYSFADEHINAVLLQGLRANPRAALIALMFGNPSTTLRTMAREHPNLGVYGSKSSVIGAVERQWASPAVPMQPGQEWAHWDETKNEFKLGEFSRFARFLQLMGPQTTENLIAATASGAAK